MRRDEMNAAKPSVVERNARNRMTSAIPPEMLGLDVQPTRSTGVVQKRAA